MPVLSGSLCQRSSPGWRYQDGTPHEQVTRYRREKKMEPIWVGKKVLVTGAGGCIGSHLTETLLAHGAQVRAFVRYNSRADPGLLSLLPNELRGSLEVVAGDLRDPQAIRQAVE